MLREIKKFNIEESDINIEFSIFQVGEDVFISITGGDKPHIGSITFGNCTEKLTKSLRNHREDIITDNMFRIISPNVKGNVLISGGIHFDNISSNKIERIITMCNLGAEKINKLLI